MQGPGSTLGLLGGQGCPSTSQLARHGLRPGPLGASGAACVASMFRKHVPPWAFIIFFLQSAALLPAAFSAATVFSASGRSGQGAPCLCSVPPARPVRALGMLTSSSPTSLPQPPRAEAPPPFLSLSPSAFRSPSCSVWTESFQSHSCRTFDQEKLSESVNIGATENMWVPQGSR